MMFRIVTSPDVGAPLFADVTDVWTEVHTLQSAYYQRVLRRRERLTDVILSAAAGSVRVRLWLAGIATPPSPLLLRDAGRQADGSKR